MAKRTYQGSCQCRRVRFEAEIDFALGTGKCNCTACWKRRWWSVRVDLASFRVLSGESELVLPAPNPMASGGGFCKHCGVTPFVRLNKADWNDGAYVSVNVASLDNLEPSVLVESKIQYMDGRADSWWTIPSEIRHL